MFFGATKIGRSLASRYVSFGSHEKGHPVVNGGSDLELWVFRNSLLNGERAKELPGVSQPHTSNDDSEIQSCNTYQDLLGTSYPKMSLCREHEV